jgi:hypothetical protein
MTEVGGDGFGEGLVGGLEGGCEGGELCVGDVGDGVGEGAVGPVFGVGLGLAFGFRFGPCLRLDLCADFTLAPDSECALTEWDTRGAASGAI